MEEKDKLRPVERLYLISKEKEGLFTKKNRLYALLYFYITNNNISITNDINIKINSSGTEYNNIYEELGLSLLREKKWLEFNTFLEGLSFNKTLIDNGILNLELKAKKFFFLKLAKDELTKTTKYYNLLAYYNSKLEENLPVLDLVCEGREYKNTVDKIYSIIKVKMQEESKVEKAKPNKSNDIDMKEAFNMKAE